MAKTKCKIIIKIFITLLISSILAIGAFWCIQYYIKYEHPIKFSEYVEKYSKENKLNKYVIYSIIKTESGFEPDSISDVGARGLMQIMEETFDWIKYKIDDEETVYDDMFDPEKNIKYGCYLIGFLYEEFGNLDCVMAAYHAGRTNVNNWLGDKNYSSDGVTLNTIPIDDTSHYINKIKKALSIYKNLYVDQTFRLF